MKSARNKIGMALAGLNQEAAVLAKKNQTNFEALGITALDIPT